MCSFLSPITKTPQFPFLFAHQVRVPSTLRYLNHWTWETSRRPSLWVKTVVRLSTIEPMPSTVGHLHTCWSYGGLIGYYCYWHCVGPGDLGWTGRVHLSIGSILKRTTYNYIFPPTLHWYFQITIDHSYRTSLRMVRNGKWMYQRTTLPLVWVPWKTSTHTIRHGGFEVASLDLWSWTPTRFHDRKLWSGSDFSPVPVALNGRTYVTLFDLVFLSFSFGRLLDPTFPGLWPVRLVSSVFSHGTCSSRGWGISWGRLYTPVYPLYDRTQSNRWE